MKSALDRFVRSLKEREEEPERCQDLGTLMAWILEQHGYTMLRPPFKHHGDRLGVAKGRLQHGIDILAAREEDGSVVSYRFVLKQGPFGKAQFTPSVEGTMLHDLELAAYLPLPQLESLHGIQPALVRLVAVHNGDVDHQQIGANLEQFLSDIPRSISTTPMEVEWWSADRLVQLIVDANPDTTIFPPAARPFYGLALHSLVPERGSGGAGFDQVAIDHLLDQRLPVGDPSTEPPRDRDLRVTIAELALFIQMLRIECERVADDTTLPVLDTCERVLCRLLEHVRRLPQKPSKLLRDTIDAVVDLYVEAASRLLERLDPVLDLPNGLALPMAGEVVSYPLRALRLSGYLATAGLASLFRAECSPQDSAGLHRARAREIAERLVQLWERNQGGCLSPVTDDQIIEIGLAWELWLRLDMTEPVARFSKELIERLALRKAVDLPLPSLWHRARVPMRTEDIQALVETHATGGANAPSSFTDEGSTLLPLALYLAVCLGNAPDRGFVEAFLPAKSGTDERVRTVFLQSWQPPEQAADMWYINGIEEQGICKVFALSEDLNDFTEAFKAFGQTVPASPAEDLGLAIVDRMAWKLWRTPSPMGLFIEIT